MERVNDNTGLRLQTDSIREHLKEKAKKAREELSKERSKRYQSIVEMEEQNESRINNHRTIDQQTNREKKTMVRKQEEKKREVVSRHQANRIKHIHLNKSIDAQDLNSKTERGEKEMARLMAFEQELIKKNSESLQASQVMQSKFKSMFTQDTSTSHLPEIRARCNQSQKPTTSQTIMI